MAELHAVPAPAYVAPESPRHLQATGARFWTEFAEEWELTDKDDLELCRLACEALDRSAQARRSLRDKGLTFQDRFGQPHPRPEIAIERQSRAAAASLIKQVQRSRMDVERLALAVERQKFAAERRESHDTYGARRGRVRRHG